VARGQVPAASMLKRLYGRRVVELQAVRKALSSAAQPARTSDYDSARR
jgi:hypothetical protein